MRNYSKCRGFRVLGGSRKHVEGGLLDSVFSDVVDYGFRVGVADGAVEFSRAPEGSPGVPPAEGGNLFEDLVG